MKDLFSKKLFIFSLILLTIIFIVFIVSYIQKYNFKINNNYTINTDENIVRIYYDFGSVPSIYQIYDFVNQSKNATAFIRWDNIPNLKDKVKNRKNVFILEHKTNSNYSPIDGKQIIEYSKKHPNAKFIIHSNDHWFRSLLRIVNSLPADSIKEINLYEDAFYTATYGTGDGADEELDRYIQTYLKPFKVNYHIQDAEYLNSYKCFLHKRCLDMKLKYKDDILVKTSLKDLRENLNKDEKIKDDYFSVYGFDYKKYQKEMVHPFGIYFFTTHTNEYWGTKQLEVMRAFLYGNLRFLNKDAQWYYKEHPREDGYFESRIEQRYPRLKKIERYLPTDILFVADIMPDYIAGFSSSVFFNVDRKTILMFIKRPIDRSLYIARREHLIRPGRIVDITISENTFKSKFKRFISRILVTFQR